MKGRDELDGAGGGGIGLRRTLEREEGRLAIGSSTSII